MWMMMCEFLESAQTACLSKVNVLLRWSQFAFVSLDTREAGLLFSYAKDVAESGVLDQDETLEDETGEEFHASTFFCCKGHVKCLTVPVCSGFHHWCLHSESAEAEGPGKSAAFFWHHLQLYLQARPGLLSVQSHQVPMVSSPFQCCISLKVYWLVLVFDLSARCKFVVAEDLLSCSQELCPGRGQAFSAITRFELLVDLTDHTGTLQSCNLRGPAAESFLGCTVRAH